MMDMSAIRLSCLFLCHLRTFVVAQQVLGNNIDEVATGDQDSDTPATEGINNDVVNLGSDNVASDSVDIGDVIEDSELIDEDEAVDKDLSTSQNSEDQSAETDDQSENEDPPGGETSADDEDGLIGEGEDEQVDSTSEGPTPAVDNVPNLVTTAGSPVLLSDLPTIAGVGIPSQIIPFTASAPFMQKSQLPEGTVFICVGALLGFLGCCVLAWRGMVAWSLHRSVRKAAASQSVNSSFKSMMLRPPGGANFYGAGLGSSVSLDKLSGMKSGGRMDSCYNRSPVAKADRRSLFFSPTAGAGLNTTNTASRSSTYLPVAVTSGTHTSMNDMGHNGGGINDNPESGSATSPHAQILNSLSHQNTHVQGYQHALNISNTPPISPSMSQSRKIGQETMKSKNSKHNHPERLVVPPLRQKLGRTPSAYLDEMFDNHGNVTDGKIVREHK